MALGTAVLGFVMVKDDLKAMVWPAEAPRTLRRLDVPEGSVQGDPVRDGDQEVGEITSVVLTRALGWVKRSSGVGELVQF